MYKIHDDELIRYIKEDVPGFDLTTHIQQTKNIQASIKIYTREEAIISCSEESARVAELLNCNIKSFISSGEKAYPNDVILSFEGEYQAVHQAWRLTQVLLEYSCAMATYAHKMKEKITQTNSSCELLATRKTFPFAKNFCIKSIIIGGAMPHRLNLGETVLFFSNHRIIYPDNMAFYKSLLEIKKQIPEKKLVVESDNYEDSIELMKYNVDVLQLDKVDLQTLIDVVKYKNKHYPNIKILAAGGINLNNAEEVAKTSVDAIVTSAIYANKGIDIGSKMELLPH